MAGRGGRGARQSWKIRTAEMFKCACRTYLLRTEPVWGKWSQRDTSNQDCRGPSTWMLPTPRRCQKCLRGTASDARIRLGNSFRRDKGPYRLGSTTPQCRRRCLQGREVSVQAHSTSLAHTAVVPVESCHPCLKKPKRPPELTRQRACVVS